MSSEPFISYAQNGEDVVLWRALGDIPNGRYVDVGGMDPVHLSVTKAFYDRGWRGVDIEPVPALADRFREQRPGNEVVQVAVTSAGDGETVLHELTDTGLSTLLESTAVRHEASGFERREIVVPTRTLTDVIASSRLLGEDIHFLKVDVEGAEADVIASLDLKVFRPWVIVIEATEPLGTTPTHGDWEPTLLEAGYTFCLFDGLSRFYASPEHPELVERLSYPACVFDEFVTIDLFETRKRAEAAEQEAARHWGDLLYWRNAAVSYWADATARVQAAQRELTALQKESARRGRRLAKSTDRVEQLKERVAELEQRVRSMDERLESRARRKVRGALNKVKGV